MANLVIKPASGSTNKLVFQNQAGNVDAITVEDSGNTTLAGTANALGTVTSGTIAGGTITSAITFPAGHILQTKQAVKVDVFASGSINDTWSVVPGLSIAITPSAASSKILVTYHVNTGMDAGSHSGVATGLYRGGSIISGAIGSPLLSSQEGVATVATHYSTDANTGIDVCSMTYLDAPSTTSATTYQVAIFNASGSAFWSYVNRTQSDGNSIYVTRGISTITVQEIAQ